MRLCDLHFIYGAILNTILKETRIVCFIPVFLKLLEATGSIKTCIKDMTPSNSIQLIRIQLLHFTFNNEGKGMSTKSYDGFCIIFDPLFPRYDAL